MRRLAIITTHPIQYYAPLFKLLQERQQIDIKVFYTWGIHAKYKFDPAFGKNIQWDIPLLDGYNYEWVHNIAADPGSHHYSGIITPELASQVGGWEPHALLVFGWAYDGHLKLLKKFSKKIPIFFRGDSNLIDDRRGVKSLIRFIFLSWIYRHIDHAFYVGTNNKNYFLKYGLKENQLSFAPHAIDNKRFGQDRSQASAKFRAHLGVDNDQLLILFAGKFETKKAPDLLIEAFISLKKPDLHLLLVGNGLLENKLKENAAGYPNIHFMDFQNQSKMPEIYQACDLFCLPSNGPGETWGLAVNEAMACQKAILVSDKVGCAVDLVKKDNGIVFQAGQIEELNIALKHLTTYPENLKRLGECSGSRINEWTFERTASSIEDKLNSMEF